MFKHQVLALAMVLSLPWTAIAQQSSKTTFPKPAETKAGPNARKPHVGVTLGSMNPDNNFSTSFEYGLDAGYQPWVPFGLGIEISNVVTDRVDDGREQDLNRFTILPRLTYNLGGTTPVIRDTYFGLGLGAIIDDGSPNQGAHLGIAPLAGFDIPLVENPTNDYVSLGLATKYVFVSGPSPNAFSVNGLVKYWF